MSSFSISPNQPLESPCLALSSVLDDDFDGRALPAIAVAFRDAAGRYAQPHIHSRPQDNPVSRPGEGLPDFDLPVGRDRRIHKQVDRADDWPVFAKAAVDVVEAVWVFAAVVIEKVVHLRAAAGMEQVVLANVVREDLEHRPVQVGIDQIADLEPKRFVAIDRDAG